MRLQTVGVQLLNRSGKKMNYLYVLHRPDRPGDEFYIGSTSDLKRRFRDHRAGRNL